MVWCIVSFLTFFFSYPHTITVELDMPEGMNYIRTPELLKRWSEFSAFGFGTDT